MSKNLNSLISLFIEAGWSIDMREGSLEGLPVCFSRYDFIPPEYIRFISAFKSFYNEHDTAWFLSTDDFNEKTDSDFKWNEFEIISLNSASGDIAWQQEIKEFWDKHIPIFLSVENGYEYVAIDITNKEDVKLVSGSEPEFEETVEVSKSLNAYLLKLLHN